MQKTIEGLVTPFVAIVIALLIGAGVMLVTGNNPVLAYGALFSGAFGSTVNLSNTFASAIPLILSGLGVAIGFKAGLFNIGAEGQYWIGSMAAVWTGYSVHGLPPILHISLCIVVGMLAAGLWAGILSLIHISEPTRLGMISYAVF